MIGLFEIVWKTNGLLTPFSCKLGYHGFSLVPPNDASCGPTVKNFGIENSVDAEPPLFDRVPLLPNFHIAPPSYPTYLPQSPDGINLSNLTDEYLKSKLKANVS